MINILIGGGLGDSVIGLSKLLTKFKLSDLQNKNKISITHIEIPAKLLKSIKEFYQSQFINATVKQINNWRWIDKHKSEYDIIIEDPAWFASSKNNNLENKKPPIKFIYKKMASTEIVISPFAGRNLSRKIPIADLRLFDENFGNKYNIVYVGWAPSHLMNIFDKFKGKNLLNRISLQKTINYICSAKIFIGCAGFAVYLASLNGIKTFFIPEHVPNYIDPRWDVTEIKSSLLDIIKI